MALENNFFSLAPLAVSGVELTVGPPDAENQVYTGAATYAAGDHVWYGGHAWRSLVDSNTGNTPVEGVNWTDLGEVDEGADEYNAGTSYALNAFAVYAGALWKSAEASNLGNTPADTSVEWTRQGATNRYKAFDGFLQDEAAQTDSLVYSMNFTEQVTTIALLRVAAANANVTITDAIDGEVYNEDFSLSDDGAVVDWWAYYFEPILQQETLLIEDLPLYTGADIQITIESANASVGQIVLGRGTSLGLVKVGTSVGIESYSLKDRDDFNRSYVVQRPYSDTVDFDLAINTKQVGYVKRQLSQREALPTLYYMSEGETFGALAYGFFQNFDILHSTPVLADCILEIEGLG